MTTEERRKIDMKKKIALLMACVMAFGVAVGGTLAWLTATDDPVVNVFTPSDISITLEETDSDDVDTDANNNAYKMVPGYTIAKDPKVTVATGSEPCWLFVKVTETEKVETFLNYGVLADWTAGTGTGEGKNGVPVGVYFREVESPNGTPYNVIFNDRDGDGEQETGEDTNVVSVKETITKDDMNDLTEATYPTLTFKAAAIQLYRTNGTKFDVSIAYDNLPDAFKS